MVITMDNTYTQAYLFTNEPLNEIMPLLPVRDANVLTITASGDQTLFFFIYMAQIVLIQLIFPLVPLLLQI